MKARRTVSFAALFVLAISALPFTKPAAAQTYTWDASGGGTQFDGSGTWNLTGSNWWSGASPDVVWPNATGATAVFGANSGAAGMVTVGSATAGALIFNAPGSGAYLLTGGTITLGGTTPTITVNAASATIASVIAGSSGLTKAGSGSLILSGTMTDTGSTTISTGKLYINGVDTASAVSVAANATLGGSGTAGSVTVASGGSLEAGSGGLGRLTVAGGLTLSDRARISIFNLSNYTAAAAIDVTGNNGLFPQSGNGAVAFAPSGSLPPGNGTIELLQYAGTVAGAGTGAFTLVTTNLKLGPPSRSAQPTLTFTNPGYIDMSYSIDYPIWTGAGGGSWYTSPNLAVSGATNWMSASSGTATNFITSDLAVFDDTATGTTTVSISGTGDVSPGSVTFNNNILNYTLQGPHGIVGVTGLVKNGSGSLTIANSNGYTGGTTLNAGLLNIANSAALGSSAGAFTINGGTLANTSGGPLTLPNPMIWNGSFAVGGGNSYLGTGSVTVAGASRLDVSGGTLWVSGAIAGSGYGLAQAGSGLFLLTGSSTYAGPIAVDGGTLSVGNGGSGAAIGITGGAALAANSTLLFNHSDSLNFASAISGPGSVVQTGGGMLTLGGANSYSGPTTVNGGTLQLGNNAALGAGSGALAVSTGSLLDLNGFSPSIGALNGNGVIDNVAAGGTLVLTIGGYPLAGGGGSGTFSGTIRNTTGSLTLVMAGPGTQFLDGTNTYTGGTEINGGTLVVASATALENSTVALSADNGLAFSVPAATLGGLSGSGSFNLGATALTIVANNNSTYSGSISGAGGVTKTGNGTLTLAGSNSYGGATNISGGILQIGGRAGGVLPSTTPLTISNGSTFDMTNSVQTIASLASTDGKGSQVLLGSGALSIAGTASTTFDGVISGNGGSLVLQGGRLVFTGANTYSGGTTVSGGTLQLGDGTAKNGSLAGNICDNSAVVFANPAAQLFSGTIGGSGSLTKIGAGTLTLAASQAYAGPTLIRAGTLQLAGSLGGFGGGGTGWTVNGSGITSTAITGDVLTLTDGYNSESRSAFYDVAVPTSAFTASFVYTAVGDNGNMADGMTFLLQNNGLFALGGGGGNLAYNGIAPSAAVEFNLYNNTNPGANGAPGTAFTSGGTSGKFTSASPVLLGSASGDPIQVVLAYNGSTLVESMTDTVTLAKYSRTFTGVNLASLVGGATAYMGFTGATGAVDSTQTISGFSFISAAEGSNNILPATTALSLSGGTLDLFGSSQTVGDLSGSAPGMVTNTAANTTSVLTVGGDNTSQTYAGTIADNAGFVALVKTGSGGLTLAAANFYSGGTTVNGGCLRAGAAGALAPNSSVAVNGGTLDATGFAQTAAALTVGPGASLNLSIGNAYTFTSSGAASLDGTLNLYGVGVGSADLIDYSSSSGSFATVNGIPPGYFVSYTPTQLELVLNGASWAAAVSGKWSVGSNWTTGAAPNGAGLAAVFSASTSSAVTVALDRPETVGALQFANPGGNPANGYIVSGTNALTLDNNGSSIAITVADGTHSISAPLVFVGGNLAVTVSNSGVLLVSGNISDDGGAWSLTLEGDGSGQLVLSGTNNYGETDVDAGTLIVTSPSALLAGSNLSVGPGASAIFGVAQPAAAPAGAVAVPEPGTLELLVAALLACGGRNLRLVGCRYSRQKSPRSS
jgi:fibronectin-binding autotransporter adhesin